MRVRPYWRSCALDQSHILLTDETKEALEKRVEEIEEGNASEQLNDTPKIRDPKSIIYTDHDDPFEMLDVSDKGGHIYSLSPLAWVACGNGIYVLELLRKGYIRIEPNGMCNAFDNKVNIEPLEDSMTHYVASWAHVSEGASPFLRSRALLTADDLAEAVEGADNYIAQRIFRNIRTSG